MGVVLRKYNGFSDEGNGLWQYSATNYSNLISQDIEPTINQVAYVFNSQGIQWLPGTIGGSYYPSGFYVYDGANWVSDRNAIAEQLNTNVDDITQIENDLTNKLNILVSTEQSTNYVANSFDLIIMKVGNSDKSITFPLSPTKDDMIGVLKIDDSTSVINVDGNGRNILGAPSDVISFQNTCIIYHYTGVQWIKR